jgi:hypothetical protein
MEYPHFTGEDALAQREQVICSKSHSKTGAELRVESRFSDVSLGEMGMAFLLLLG